MIILAIMGSSALAGKSGEGAMGGLLTPVNAVMGVVALFVAFFILKSFWKMLGCITWILIFAVLAGGAFFMVNSGGFDLKSLQEMIPTTEEQAKDGEKDTDRKEQKEEKEEKTEEEKKIELLQKQLDELKNKQDKTSSEDTEENKDEEVFASLVDISSENKPVKQVQQQSTPKDQQNPNKEQPIFGMGSNLGNQLGSALGATRETDLGSAFNSILNGQAPQQQPPQQQQQQAPPPPPTIKGNPYVVNGDTLKINGRRVRLFGIDAPDPNQMCAAKTGASYNCGTVATRELKKMIGRASLECKIREQDAKGNVIASCSNGKYDMGVAMVVSGWAVAYRPFSQFYVPYEEQAKAQRRGLWAGNFYMPWDWRKNEQNRRQKMRANSRRSRGGGGILGGMLD